MGTELRTLGQRVQQSVADFQRQLGDSHKSFEGWTSLVGVPDRLKQVVMTTPPERISSTCAGADVGVVALCLATEIVCSVERVVVQGAHVLFAGTCTLRFGEG